MDREPPRQQVQIPELASTSTQLGLLVHRQGPRRSAPTSTRFEKPTSLVTDVTMSTAATARDAASHARSMAEAMENLARALGAVAARPLLAADAVKPHARGATREDDGLWTAIGVAKHVKASMSWVYKQAERGYPPLRPHWRPASARPRDSSLRHGFTRRSATTLSGSVARYWDSRVRGLAKTRLY